jgi:ElaB/YqjD/DUF883 family membrane-anchored ribosome-binding protein
MGQDPDAIRRDIEQTRDRMGDTVEALGYKADVPTRAKENIQGKVDSVKSKFGGATDTISERTPDGQQVKQGAKQAVGMAQSNPLGLAVGAAAFGFLAGMLIPETQKEHEKLGQMSDQVTDQVKSTAQEALQHGKDAAQQVAQQTAQTAKETAQQAAQEHGSELKQTAQDNAQQAAQQAREQVPS